MAVNAKQNPQEMSWHSFFSMMAVLGVFVGIIWASNHGFSVSDFQSLAEFLLKAVVVFTVVAIGVALSIRYGLKRLAINFGPLRPFLVKTDGILVGATSEGDDLYLPENFRSGHVQIIGSTGRGKTESVILPWIVRDIYRRHSPILIDGKGDRSLVEKVKSAYSGKVTYFDLEDPKNSIVTNPLKNGTPLQITDRLFAAFEFEDPYYRDVQHRVCLDTVKVIIEGFERPTFKRIYELLTDDEKMTDMLQWTKTEILKKDMVRFLSESRKDRDQKLSGLLSQLAPLATSEIAPFVNGYQGVGRYEYSLSDFLLCRPMDQEAMLVFLPTLKYQKIAHQLGKIFCQEIGWAISEREHQPSHMKDFLPIYMDEFSAFVYPGFADILNKARSANVSFHLSHQGMGDLERVSPEFASMVNTNTNVKCVLGVNDPDTAEYYARHFGTKGTQKLTGRVQRTGFGGTKETGEYSQRDTEEYVIHPNEMKKLTHGKGILHVPGQITERVQFARLHQ